MSRLSLDEELNTPSRDYDVRGILSDYWAQATEDEASASEKRGVSRSSLSSLQAEAAAEESVRIYQPRRDRSNAQERVATRWQEPAPEPEPAPAPRPKAEELQAEVMSAESAHAPDPRPKAEGLRAELPLAEPEPAESETPAPAPEKPAWSGSASLRAMREKAGGLLNRLRRDRTSAAEPQELPSFEELLWGKKEEPVRIVEEEDEEPPLPIKREERPAPPPPAPEKTRLPSSQELPRRAAEPEMEVHIPKEELTGLSVDAILAEYWGGLEERPTPVEPQPLPRRESSPRPRREEKPPAPPSEKRAAPSRPEKEKTRIFQRMNSLRELLPGKEKTRVFRNRSEQAENAAEKETPKPERPAPAPQETPKPERPASAPQEAPRPQTKPALSAEELALNMSVADILSEFWAGYTETEEPSAPRTDAPRSRREAARMREEAAPVPPTGAASSAADRSAARREKSRQEQRRQAPPAEAQPRREKSRQEQPRQAPAAEAQPRREKPRQEQSRQAPAAEAQPRREKPRQEQPRQAPAAEAQPRREKPRQEQPRQAPAAEAQPRREDRRSKAGKSARRTGSRPPARLDAVRPLPVEEESAAPPVPPPPPVDPVEASALFGFLHREKETPSPAPRETRRSREEAPAPRKEAPAPRRDDPAPRKEAPAPRKGSPREMKDEDTDLAPMSVDDILAEYNDIFAALPAAADAIGAQRKAEAAKTEREQPAAPSGSVSPKPEPVPSKPQPTRPRDPDSRVSRMEAEAKDFLRQMRSESFGARREERRPQGGLRSRRTEPAAPPEPKPAPAAVLEPEPETEPAPEPKAPAAPMPSVADAEWGNSLRRLLGQDPAPPQPVTEPSRQEDAAIRPATRPGRTVAIPSDEVDPRFNLSGEHKRTMVFGGKELDLSADENYVPPKASENVGFHWVAGEEELPGKPLEKKPLFHRARKESAPAEGEKVERSEGYDDRSQPQYAPDRDYDEDDERNDPGAFPSFGQYLSGMVSTLLVRLFGARHKQADNTGTMEDESEELGPEVSPAAASKYYGSFVTGLRMRVRIALVLLLVMAWITLGLPVSGALRSVQVASGMVLAIQLTMLLLGLDVVTGAAVNLARGRFGADSLALLCCVFTSLDALSVCLGFMGTPHMPLCLISSLSLLGILLSSLAAARGMRKALRVPAIGKRCYGVTAEAEVKGSGLTLLKSLRPPKGFVRRTEEAAPDEDAFLRVSPILALTALVLALVVSAAKHAFGEFLYILTVLICPAVPMMALLCFALPYLFGSLRIFHSGAAIAGWSGVSDIGRSENLIVTDRDLFPEGSVEIDTVRIFAEIKPETVISYAGTMVCASGSDLAPCFAQLMERNGCPMCRVDGFEYLSGGGMKGVIDGSVILCGGLDLMRLMNIRVPYRLVSKTTVLLAVDGILCGIFNMKYEGQPQVRKALVGLIRSNRHPVFAIRDFLVTPEMLADCFEIATDGYDFPPYVDRFAISEAEPSAGSKLAAVVCREGLGPLVHMADTGRSMYLAVRLNLLLTVLAAVLGVGVAFVKLLSAGAVSGGFLLLFLLFWALPVLLISLFMRL